MSRYTITIEGEKPWENLPIGPVRTWFEDRVNRLAEENVSSIYTKSILPGSVIKVEKETGQ